MNMHNPGTSVHMFKFIVLQNHQYPCLDKLDDCLHTTFAGATYELAIVDKFQQPQKDADTGQWWVSPTTFDTIILQLSDLFPPQVGS